MAGPHKPHKLQRAANLKVTRLRLLRAHASLKATGVQVRARHVSLRLKVNPAVLKAAMDRTGISRTSTAVNAALMLLAAEDDFGRFLISRAGELSEDFEGAV